MSLLAGLLPASCSQPMMLEDVATVYPSDEPLAPEDSAYDTTLQVRWMGTACYHIQLGDVAILTDPFFSHHTFMDSFFGEIPSDFEWVRSKITPLQTANAIFLGHAHYDHMLDLVPTLDQPGWAEVPVYGSPTAKYIMCGYGEDYMANWNQALFDGQWHEVASSPAAGTKLEYKAFLSQHAPQIPGLDLYPYNLDACLPAAPMIISDFPKGENFAYVLRFSNAQAEFTIYMVTSATDAPFGFPDDGVTGVDLAILGVAGWANVEGFPDAFITRLQPRYILPGHFNDFFEVQDPEATPLLSLADLEGFLDRVDAVVDYPNFEAVRLPEVDSLMLFDMP